MEVVVGIALSIRGDLVENHHIRKGEAKKVVVGGEQGLKYVSQISSFFFVHLPKRTQMVLRVDVHLIGIAGKKGHKSAKASTFRDYPSAISTFLLQDIAVKAAFLLVIVFLSLAKFLLGDGRDVGKGIDLAVGMGKGH
ncbi:hypothetical protein HKBW3S33_00602, partial [Candidatus Hakubella thermalkaliphila]